MTRDCFKATLELMYLLTTFQEAKEFNGDTLVELLLLPTWPFVKLCSSIIFLSNCVKIPNNGQLPTSK